MKQIAILGSTGSIGTSTLKVVEQFPDRFAVRALAAGRNVDLLLEQIECFKPQLVSVGDAELAARVRREYPHPGLEVVFGHEGLRAVAADSGADMVIAALVGSVGLESTLAAVEAGIDVALANKETLVVAGEIINAAARKSGARLVPLDSEHAALHQLLDGRPPEQVHKLVLTASGGPFRSSTREELAAVTVAAALRHPTWSMGDKITIDSATLANKGLEVIEAQWLFAVPASRIEVLVHPQSIVHAMIEMVDGTLQAQLGVNDMCGPIQYAMTYPERCASRLPALDLVAIGRLEFEAPDTERFPCLRLAFAAAQAAGTSPAVFNAANEVANAAFRRGELDFLGIASTIEVALEALEWRPASELDEVLDADRRARELAAAFAKRRRDAMEKGI